MSTSAARSPRTPRPIPVQRYARVTGILLLLTIVGGFFGEVYVPGRLLVASDAAATAHNITASTQLFRLGFAAYLLEALCDVGLSWLLYILLRPVQRELALLAAFLGLVSTSLYGIAEVFYFAPPLLLGGAGYLAPFSHDQLDAMALLAIKLYGRVGGMFMVFYGAATVVRGYLMLRSRYLPRALGVLLLIAGTGFIVRNLLLVLAPSAASDLLLAPMFLAVVSLAAWLLVRGVDVREWELSVAGADRADD